MEMVEVMERVDGGNSKVEKGDTVLFTFLKLHTCLVRQRDVSLHGTDIMKSYV